MDQKQTRKLEDIPSLFGTPPESKIFTTPLPSGGTLFEYYLVGAIGDPENYVDLCHALRTATQRDKFLIHFNSGGGQVRTGNMIINALNETDATTIGHIEHDCGSMATFIFLACDAWSVGEYAEWFSHTVSGGNYGKECETHAASEFLHRITLKRLRKEYAHFLTEEEIENVIRGTDIYLDAEEVEARLEVFADARDAREKEEVESEEEETSPSIQEMIAQAVADGLAIHFPQKKKKVAESVDEAVAA